METDRKWIIVRIDGKIAGVSHDYRTLARITSYLTSDTYIYKDINITAVSFNEIWRLRQEARWEDLLLFGSDFQKKVWRTLWKLTHPESGLKESNPDTDRNVGSHPPRLISYSDFAELCQNRAGVRAVAHAIGKNPISVIIPCHLVIPKESIDKIVQIHKKAESTIFKGEDLCRDSLLRDKSIDFGEYSLGRDLKRELIIRELN